MIKSLSNAEHYSWGSNCQAWRLLQSDQLSVIEEVMPKGTCEQLHYHKHAQQLFYILSGVATFLVEAEELVVQAGESLHIVAGQRHLVRNNSDADLSFLVISQPATKNDRVNL